MSKSEKKKIVFQTKRNSQNTADGIVIRVIGIEGLILEDCVLLFISKQALAYVSLFNSLTYKRNRTI